MTTASLRLDEQFVVFALQTTQFAVRIRQVLRITRILPMTRVPRAPAFVEGVVNDHGQIVPVVDLRKRMALLGKAGDADKVRILILELLPTPTGKEQVLGLLVDAVVGISRIAGSDIQPPPEMVAQVNGVYLTGVARVGEQLVMILDLDRVFTIEEVGQVGAWINQDGVKSDTREHNAD